MSVPTDDQINALVAEACGWRLVDDRLTGRPPFITTEREYKIRGNLSVPNYVADLNAMHEVVATLNTQQIKTYVQTLESVVAITSDDWKEFNEHRRFKFLESTARQRAEAFLRTIGKWPKEDRDP